MANECCKWTPTLFCLSATNPLHANQCTYRPYCVSRLQYMHPDSSAHEGYALVPPVLAELPSLQSLRLTVNSGQSVDLTPAAAVPEVNLVLTLAHYEQTPFNRSVQCSWLSRRLCVGVLIPGVKSAISMLPKAAQAHHMQAADLLVSRAACLQTRTVACCPIAYPCCCPQVTPKPHRSDRPHIP
jgi:hypothetical protein